MTDETVQVNFGGNTSGLESASSKSVAEIGNVGKAAQALTNVFRGLSGVAKNSFGGAMFSELRAQIQEVTHEAKEAGAEAIGLKEMFGLAFGGITAALSLPALVEFGEKMGEMVEQTDQQSQKLGISAEKISEWGGVMTLNGQKTSTFVTATTRLERSMSLAAGGAKAQSTAFKQLGIDINANRDPTQMLLTLSDKFKGMDDGPKKIALAMQLMGRGGTALIPTLNQGSEAIKEMQQTAIDYGATMDEAFVQKGLRVADAFNEQKLASQGLKNILFDEFAPVIASVVEYFNSLTKSMVESYREGGTVAVILGTIKVAFTAVVLAIETVVTGLKELWSIAVTACAVIEQSFITLGMTIYDALHGNFTAAKDDLVNGTAQIVDQVKKGMADLSKINADYIKSAGTLLHGDGKEHKSRPEDNNGDIASGTGGGKAKDDRMQQWQAELTAKMQAEKNYFGDSKAEELAFWTAKLALTTTGSKAQQQVQSKIYELSKGIAQDQYRADMENFDYKKQLAKDDYDTQLSLENQKLAEVKKLYGADSAEYLKATREKETMERAHKDKLLQIDIQARQTRGTIDENAATSSNAIFDADIAARQAHNSALEAMGRQSATKTLAENQALDQQLLAQQQAFENQIYQIKLKELQDEAAMPGQSPDKVRELNTQIEILQASHVNKLAELQDTANNKMVANADESAKAAQQKWENTLQPITNAFSNAFVSIFNKSKSVGDAIKGVFVSLGESMIQSATKAAGTWIAKEIAKTAVHTAQTSIRTGTELAAKATAAATQATTGVAEVLSNAAIAASAAFASTAAIPIVGPALAPEAAAAAYAAVAAFAPAASAAGGYDIPSGVNPIVQTHAEEMILPRSLANPFRNMLANIGMPSSGLSGSAASAGEQARASNNTVNGGHTFNFKPQVNHQSADLETLLRSQGSAMRKWVRNEARNGTFSTGK